MIIFLYILNILCATGRSTVEKVYAINHGENFSFIISKTFFGAIIFAIYSLIVGFSFHLPTLIYSVMYGMFLVISMYSGLKALKIGPMALTSILVSFSLIIPYLYGVLLLDERITEFSVFGMIFLVISIVVLTFRKEGNISPKWLLYVFLTLVTNGFCSIIQKLHQTKFPGSYRNEFMIFSLLFVFLVLLILSFIKRHNVKFNFYGTVSGVLNSGANYIVLYLSAIENASVLFPVVSITNIIAVWIMGRIKFKEKLRPVQVFGLIAGVISVIFFNLKR